MGRWGSKVLNFLVKIHIQLFLLQTSRNVLKHIIHKWGGHIRPFHDDLRTPKKLTVTHWQQKPVFLGLCLKSGYAVGGWGSRVLNKNMEFWLKKLHFFQKSKCSKWRRKQNKLNFYFSLSGVLNVRGGWVGSGVWDKVLKKTGFFFDTFPKIELSHHLQTNLLVMVLTLVYFKWAITFERYSTPFTNDFIAHGFNSCVL